VSAQSKPELVPPYIGIYRLVPLRRDIFFGQAGKEGREVSGGSPDTAGETPALPGTNQAKTREHFRVRFFRTQGILRQ